MCAILVYETKTASAFKLYETYTNPQKQILTFKKTVFGIGENGVSNGSE